MALANVIEPERARVSLEHWLAGQLPGATEVRVRDVAIPSASGVSNETVLFSATWLEAEGPRERGLVARVSPGAGGGVIPTSYDLRTEYLAIRALHDHTDVPVPEPLWFEEDPSVLGAPFLVLDRLSGRVPADDPPFTTSGWVLELTSPQRTRLDDAGLATLARIHAVGPAALADVPGLQRTLEERIALYEAFYTRVAGDERVPNIDAGFRWLREHRPAEPDDARISWGDARPGNIMFGAEQEVVGVLDWEMIGFGAPELDLGWWLFFLRHHTEAMGVRVPDGMADRARTIDRYEELSGRRVDAAAVDFYEAFAGLRASVMMVRASQLMTEAGLLPPGHGMAQNNAMLQLFSSLAGLPAPDGSGVHFIGNR
jgi:aminoglycoside phosphotransferase (APT) family kinase protein